MDDNLLCCGIDVSHLTLDVTYQNNLGELFLLQVGNNKAGFKKILEHTGTNYHFVMEATGVYFIRLAFYLHEQGCRLSVVNAISIKRYIQMHLERNKSDKRIVDGFAGLPLSSVLIFGKCPTALILRASSCITPSGNTPSRSSGLIINCTA